jgi:3-methyladenine DNA glycosylase/8-oxoguanine DNA glycosylase
MSPPSLPHAAAVTHLRAADERMAALIDRTGPCRLAVHDRETVGAQQHFEGLVSAIVSQQLSSKAAGTILGRVRALGLDESGALSAEKLLSLPEPTLRGAGLSGAKTRYVRDLCDRVVRGALPLDRLHDLDDEAVIETLCGIKGVGRWTAEMVLIFRLGRQDVLPVDDLGIQKGFQRLFGLRKLPPAERMVKLSKPFRPFRSVACWYLWRLNEEP